METVISVGRNGVEIGDFNLASIKEGLASGYFLPTDYGWYVGLEEWKALPEIVQDIQPAGGNLEAIGGVVKYTLKGDKARSQRKKRTPRPHADEVPTRDWHDEPATEKQILYLKSMRASHIDPSMTKGRAHELIQQFIDVVSKLSDKQIACLQYHGFDPIKMTLEQCSQTLDNIHRNPAQYTVPEPWETAKHRLYPALYPASEKKQTSGCAALILGLAFCGIAFVYFLLRMS
jgi:hypothetical protein